MTDSPLIPNDDPMVRVARLLDHAVDKLHGAITTLDRAHVDGDRRDRLPLKLVTDTLQKLVSEIEATRKTLGSEELKQANDSST